MRTEIYPMDNNGFSGVTWNRTTRVKSNYLIFKKKVTAGVQASTAKLTEGLCFGYSTIWATRMVNGVKPEDTFPKELNAGLLQQKVEMWQKKGGWDSAVEKAVTDLGCKVVRKLTPNWDKTADRLSGHRGIYLVDIGIHWVAMGKKDGVYYYFDANEGLYSYTSQIEFKQDVNSPSNFGYYKANDWMANPGAVCNCYEIAPD